MISSFHGIAAYSGNTNVVELLERVMKAVSGVQVCTADRPIGPYGIVIFGELDRLFDGDVWSFVNDDGTRDRNHYHHDVLADADIDQHDYERRITGLYSTVDVGERYYCESWVRGHHVRAVWVKSHATWWQKIIARILARRIGVPMITVTGKCRIWDVLDNNCLPFKTLDTSEIIV